MVITDEKEIMQIVDKHMRRWPLFGTCHKLMVHPIPQRVTKCHQLYDGSIVTLQEHETQQKGTSLSFHGTDTFVTFIDQSVPRWMANITGDVFYLLSIFLPKKDRGQGHGASLY